MSHSQGITNDHSKIHALVLLSALFVLLVFAGCRPAYADDIRTFQIEAVFDQVEARRMLTVVNQYRAENNIASLSYDYSLEQAAMQRAAEIAVSYSHTRPDGSKWSTAVSTAYLTQKSYSTAENLCRWEADEIKAESAVSAFQSSPPHNAAMLNSSYTAAGFGYAEVDGYGCWVQLFRSALSSMPATQAATGKWIVDVNVSSGLLYYSIDTASLYVYAGDTVQLPVLWLMAGDVRYAAVAASWSSGDPSAAVISGNTVTAAAPCYGVSLTASAPDGSSHTCSLYAYAVSLYDASITLSATEFTYSGKAHTPSASVICKGKTLTRGKDFTISYSNNTDAGTGYATITGTGIYSGSATRSFTIKKANVSLKVSLSPAAVEEGKTSAIKVNVDSSLCSFSSGNTAVAYIPYSGTTIRTQAAGTAIITAIYSGDRNHNPATATATLTVRKKTVKETTAPPKETTAKPKETTAKPKETTAKPKETAPSGPKETTAKPKETTAAVPDVSDAPALSKVKKKMKKVKDSGELSGSSFSLLQVQTKKVNKTSITLRWNRVPGATGYLVYGNRCGKKYSYKKLYVIKNGKATSKKIKKIKSKKLKKGTYYKFIVTAVAQDGSGTYKVLASSKSVHIITAGNKRYSNFTKVTLKNIKNGALTLTRGKTFAIKARQKKPSGKKVKIHRGLAYESDNPAVASVSSSGVITAKSRGTCHIFVYAQNGKYRKILVTVP